MTTPGDDEFISIYSAGSSFEAHVLKSKLLAADIECCVDNDGLQGIQGEIPFGITTSPRIWVSRKNAEAAKDLLNVADADSETLDETFDDEPDLDEPDLDQPESDDVSKKLGESRFRREWIVIAVLVAICAFTVWGIIQSDRESLVAGFRWEGYRATDRGEFDVALQEFTKAIETTPSDGSLYGERGYIYSKLKMYAEAVEDYSRAIEIGVGPHEADFLFSRAVCRQICGDYENARQDYESALILVPDDVEIRNALAWILAACPEDAVRDGRAAVDHAQKCVTASDEPEWYLIDTLAAAHAECGDFEEAVKTQARVVELAPSTEKDRSRKALELYQEDTPYRFQAPDFDL